MKILTTTSTEKDGKRGVVLIPERSDAVPILKQILLTLSPLSFLIIFLPDKPSALLFQQVVSLRLLENLHHQRKTPICFVLADPRLESVLIKKKFGFIVAPEGLLTKDDLRQAFQNIGKEQAPQKARTIVLTQQKKYQDPRPKAKYFWIAATLILLALGSLIGGMLLQFPSQPWRELNTDASQVVGYVSFASSGQGDEESAQGIADQVVIGMNGIAEPAANQSYYAWLLPDKNQSDSDALLLGKLSVSKSKARLFYAGDQLHTNLLLKMCRFLVTEENTTVQPLVPSPDQSTWRFNGEFPTAQQSGLADQSQYEFIDHLRHLLSSDPTLKEQQLPGGLDTWFSHNTRKILGWATSLRDGWEEKRDIGNLHHQVTAILAYLDGISFVSQDLPATMLVQVNTHLAGIGLIQVAGSAQQPPSYITQIVHHLNGLEQAASTTHDLHPKIALLVNDLTAIEQWLSKVRIDAKQLMSMSDNDLKQNPETLNLINDMVKQVSNAYAGQIDPATGKQHQGVAEIQQQIQALATLYVAPFHAK